LLGELRTYKSSDTEIAGETGADAGIQGTIGFVYAQDADLGLGHDPQRRCRRSSKWGIIGLMKSAAMELGQYNVTVNALIPDLVDTALTPLSGATAGEHGGDRAKAAGKPDAAAGVGCARTDRAAKGGWLQPDDISPAAVFLASDAAAMVTGAEYQVTGGDSAKDI
jgi:NAD(P)-dependent dehydrogenase (short-subunit alcohol dehydrogenase family)